MVGCVSRFKYKRIIYTFPRPTAFEPEMVRKVWKNIQFIVTQCSISSRFELAGRRRVSLRSETHKVIIAIWSNEEWFSNGSSQSFYLLLRRSIIEITIIFENISVVNFKQNFVHCFIFKFNSIITQRYRWCLW
jgi:hypothetical protein